MSPLRKATIRGVLVEEYYWAGRYVVYLDNRLTPGSFEMNCAILEAGQ